MRTRLLTTVLLAAVLGTFGCAQRYTVESRDLMRGDAVEDVHVRTADGYDYHFHRGQVRGDQFVGVLVEEVEVVGEDDQIYVTNEVREVELPLSTVVEVVASKRKISSNALYVAGAVGAGAIVYAALSGDDILGTSQRGSGPAIKPVP
jgi:hypothetical protein